MILHADICNSSVFQAFLPSLLQHTSAMAAINTALIAREAAEALNAFAKREDSWPHRNPGVMVVFCIVFVGTRRPYNPLACSPLGRALDTRKFINRNCTDLVLIAALLGSCCRRHWLVHFQVSRSQKGVEATQVLGSCI